MKRSILPGLIFAIFLTFLSVPAGLGVGEVEVSAPPAFNTMKDWIAAIRSTRPGLRLLLSNELKPGIFLAIFQSSNDCLVVSLWDAAAQSSSPRVSFEIRDASGHDLLDLPRTQKMSSEDLCLKYKITTGSDSMTGQTVLGFYHAIKNNYTGKASVVVIMENGKQQQFPITIERLP